MAEAPDKAEEQFAVNIPQPGMKGVNTLQDPTAIDNMQMADARNVFFDNGMLTPRTGSQLFAAKPDGETGLPLEMFTATTADKVDYLVSVFDGSFYVWDAVNNDYIKINGAYAPSFTTLIHGHTNWVKGFANDYVYGGNGRDHSWSWLMGIGYLSVTTAGSDTQITLSDSRRFPATGAAIINNGGTLVSITITGNTVATGVVTISGTVGAIIPAGSAVVMAMVDQNGHIPLASLFISWQNRLIAANAYQAESLVNYSVTDDPLDFATATGITGAGSFYITDGNGPITGLYSQGQYVMIGKPDCWVQFSFQFAADLSGKTTNTPTVVSGDGVGPINGFAATQAQNVIYYPTSVNGLYALEPVTSSTTTTLKTDLLSESINTTVTEILSFQNGRTAVFGQKLLFGTAVPSVSSLNRASVASANNTIVLMYDLIYKAWSFFDTWNVRDWTQFEGGLYYLDNLSGNVYQCFVGQDDNGTTFVPYAVLKEMDYGQPAMPKSQDLVYVAGLIDPATQLKVEVMYNRKGSLGTQTFTIDGSADYVTSVPIIPLGGNAPLGSIPLGAGVVAKNQGLVNQLADNTGFFRVYLQCNYGFGFYTLQLKFYSQKQGDFWGVLVCSHNPNIAPTYPVEFVIGPNTNAS